MNTRLGGEMLPPVTPKAEMRRGAILRLKPWGFATMPIAIETTNRNPMKQWF